MPGGKQLVDTNKTMYSFSFLLPVSAVFIFIIIIIITIIIVVLWLLVVLFFREGITKCCDKVYNKVAVKRQHNKHLFGVYRLHVSTC